MKSLCNTAEVTKTRSEIGKRNKGRKYPTRHTPQYKNCKYCGKTFELNVKNGQKQKDNTRFCSSDCWYKFIRKNPIEHGRWKGGRLPYYGPNWNCQKRKARERDQYTCQYCGKTEQEYGQHMDVHHIVAFREFGIEKYKEANNLTNLICLCKSCHAKTL